MMTTLHGPGVVTVLHFPDAQGEPLTTAGADSVIVVPRLGGRLLMVMNKGRSGWEFPGGKVTPGEEPEAAARREVAEEAGASLGELAVVCTYLLRKGDLVSRGAVYSADVIGLGERTDTETIEEVSLFEKVPPHISFADGFVELMFGMFGEAKA
ncbi:MAG: putative 8-oxo-dGTP diphosphatase YtkD [Firmicutes bacterium ADurb.Bin506]|jgi:nucleoside triphosphatase YtkD|nr:MAG: putative 8-oxo-dGTP diphosphatase YtkD [Firmicutes bacterium ADurb.Bin506]